MAGRRASVDGAVGREEAAEDLEKDLGELPAADGGDERALAHALDRAEEKAGERGGRDDEEDVDAGAQVAEGAAPAPDDADDETFGRQDRQTREDHARNAHAVEDRADEDRRKLLEVGGGRDEGRERIGRVEEEAEDEADRNLLDELHEKP